MKYKTATDSRIRLGVSTKAPKDQAKTTTSTTGQNNMSTKTYTNHQRAINQLSDNDINELTRGLEDIAEVKRQREQSQREFDASGKRQALELALGRPLVGIPEEALVELADVIVNIHHIRRDPLALQDLKARLEREVKAVEEREAFRKSIQYTCTRLLAGTDKATHHKITHDYVKPSGRFKKSFAYNNFGSVSLIEFSGVQKTTADGFSNERAASDLLAPPTSAPTLFKDDRTQYLHKSDVNRIDFWQSLGFNFVNRPRGVVVAALVNDGSIRAKQIVDLDELHYASTGAFTCGPQVGDHIEWLNVIFHDQLDAHYVLGHGDLAEFGYVDNIEKVLP